MKKILIALLAFSSVAMSAEHPVNITDGESKYVETDRFIVTDLPEPLYKVITDTRTGCQFLLTYRNGISQIPLGCFEEYKKK
ncbi:hypothetical protein OBP_290 [Pseudomonas phage OBP]|uniref:hypothetical protein n=1 Tax=Pseudomonas phage OBP TaxID=1124849 RepID=UPI000240D63D|nr:hypothetical protein OBP_290 [Pseudomonas phage OBP]AEV89727.1 hypothetical protein OBP_290 [Pseudomonas phage OBP]